MSEHEVEEFAAMAVIHPGDRVLLLAREQLTVTAAENIKGRLGDRFPGVEFSIIDGMRGALVHRTPPAQPTPAGPSEGGCVMGEAPDIREDDCPSAEVCAYGCDLHYDSRGPCTCPSNCEIHGKATPRDPAAPVQTGGLGLAEGGVLAVMNRHHWIGLSESCRCGWTNDEQRPDGHRAHVAAEVESWLIREGWHR